MKKIICLCLMVLAGTVSATTYYVDYDSGVDTRTGQTPALAWKHSPGDPAAASIARSTALKGGDVVLFKGNVIYRGNIVPATSGTSGNPISFKGNGWGTGQAIIDGSNPITTAWTRCASANDCQGNPHEPKHPHRFHKMSSYCFVSREAMGAMLTLA